MLAMGHYTRVTQVVSRMNRKPGGKLEKSERCLLNLGIEEGTHSEVKTVIFLGLTIPASTFALI